MPNPSDIEKGARAVRAAGPIWGLVIVVLGLVVYIGIDKVAMADRWTASDQKEYAAQARDEGKALDARLRAVETRYAELMAKVDALATGQGQLQAALGEIRGLLMTRSPSAEGSDGR